MTVFALMKRIILLGRLFCVVLPGWLLLRLRPRTDWSMVHALNRGERLEGGR